MVISKARLTMCAAHSVWICSCSLVQMSIDIKLFRVNQHTPFRCRIDSATRWSCARFWAFLSQAFRCVAHLRGLMFWSQSSQILARSGPIMWSDIQDVSTESMRVRNWKHTDGGGANTRKDVFEAHCNVLKLRDHSYIIILIGVSMTSQQKSI